MRNLMIGCLSVVVVVLIGLLVFLVARARQASLGSSVAQPAAAIQPALSITWPPNGARVRVGQSFNIQATAQDPRGVFQVSYTVDGQPGTPVSTQPPVSTFVATIPVTLQAKGVHTIVLQANSTTGAQTPSAQVRVVAVQSLSDPSSPSDPPLPDFSSSAGPVDSGDNQPAPPNASVNFGVDPVSVQAGGCATWSWQVDGVREIYLDGVGVTGPAGGYQQCQLTQPTTHSLQAVFVDGSSQNYSATVDVTTQVVVSGKPDLVLTDAHIEPGEATSGRPFNAVFSVENRGDVPSGPFTVFWQFHQVTGLKDCCEREFPNGLAAKGWGGGTFANLVTNSAAGNSPSWVEVDHGNRIDEGAAEGNNRLSLSLTVLPGTSVCTGEPGINTFSASPASIAPGGSTTLSWDVIKGESVEIDQGIGSVNALGSKTVSPNTPTTYKLTARCGGNSTTKQVTVNVSGAQGLDVMVENLIVTEDRSPNQPINFEITVRNAGTANVSNARWTWTIAPAGQPVGLLNTGGTFNVAAGARATLNGTAPAQPVGNYVVAVTLNAEGDTNSSNNTKTSNTIHVAATAAFEVTSVTASVSPATFSGQCPKNFTLNGKIVTNGAGTVTYHWVKSLNGEATPDETVTFAQAGEKQVTGTWSLNLTGVTPPWWVKLVIVSPNHTMSTGAEFTLNCTSSSSSSSAAFALGSVKVSDLAAVSGTCPKKATFSGTIAATNGGTVTYHWEQYGPDGKLVHAGDSKTLTFTGSGAHTQNVTSGEMSFDKTGTFRARLKVTLPSDAWDEGEVKVTCAQGITSAGANVPDLAATTGACPKRVTFSGTISAVGTGTVTYHWEWYGSEGNLMHSGDARTLAFSGSGQQTQSVTSGDMDLAKSGTYRARLKITAPTDAWDEGKVTITCK